LVRVLWLNRHNPREVQINALKSILGDVDIHHRVEGINTEPQIGVPQVMGIIKEIDADEIICSLPIQHLEGLLNAGIKPIRAIMARTPSDRFDGNQEREYDFEFQHFERVEYVRYEAQKL
jgi:hypothetical protein